MSFTRWAFFMILNTTMTKSSSLANLLTDFKDSIAHCINSQMPGDTSWVRPFLAIRYLIWSLTKKFNQKPLELRLPDNIQDKVWDHGWWMGFWRKSIGASFQIRFNGSSFRWSILTGLSWVTTEQECWVMTLTETGTLRRGQKSRRCSQRWHRS